jgi:hypothetical protein
VTDEQKALLGAKAKELLENEALQKALSSLDGYYVTAWRNARTLEAREDAFRYVQVCKKIISDIEAVVKDGQISTHRINELEGRKKGFFG